MIPTTPTKRGRPALGDKAKVYFPQSMVNEATALRLQQLADEFGLPRGVVLDQIVSFATQRGFFTQQNEKAHKASTPCAPTNTTGRNVALVVPSVKSVNPISKNHK